jgi:hypothetical protein
VKATVWVGHVLDRLAELEWGRGPCNRPHISRFEGALNDNPIYRQILLKRGLKGTYVAVEPFHLDRYVTEQVFRFNNRATKDNPLTDADRFMLAVSQISGKRLTYAELTGKVGETSEEAF